MSAFLDIVWEESMPQGADTLLQAAANACVEAEGLTVWPAPDGSLVHVLDYNKAVGIFLRHYKLPAGE